MTINPASPQDTFDHVFGSGAIQYSWWVQVIGIEGTSMFTLDQPEDWKAKVTAEDPENADGTVVKVVTHAVVMKAARRVASGKSPITNSTTVKECLNLVFHADDADLDAVVADNLLQYIVYGSVIFG